MRKLIVGASTAALLLGCLAASWADDIAVWPAGLKDAVSIHFSTLQRVEFAIRDSDAKSPVGIVPTNTFDRANHECHEASGQAYRLYGDPALKEKAEDNAYVVTADFQLFYREANTDEDLFKAPWKEGSGGALEVRFNREEEVWRAVKVRELAIPSKKAAHPK